MLLDKDVAPATPPSSKRSGEQNRSSEDIALPTLTFSSSLLITGPGNVANKGLCQLTESSTSKMVEPSPLTTAYNVPSADVIHVLKILKTTSGLDATI